MPPNALLGLTVQLPHVVGKISRTPREMKAGTRSQSGLVQPRTSWSSICRGPRTKIWRESLSSGMKGNATTLESDFVTGCSATVRGDSAGWALMACRRGC